MINPILTAKIFSELGSGSSLLPIAVKDVSNSLGITTGSYITGSKVEGKDRFIDEFGTQIIWIGGIPFFKKMIDLSVYKLAKFNPKVDVRILKDKDILKKAIEKAPENIKTGLERIAGKSKTFHGLFITKFIAATVLTMASYSALTHYRHKQTEKSLIKEIQKEEITKKANDQFIKSKSSINFKAVDINNKHIQKNNSQNAPSFGMNMKGLNDFMFNPVKNMMIVDGGITTERLVDARNPQDFAGYVIKEGFFWGFMYFAQDIIQEQFEKSASKGHKPIDLDIKVLQNKKFQKLFETKEIQKHLDNFGLVINKKRVKNSEIYEALFKEGIKENSNEVGQISDNLIVKMAKKSGIIKTFKNTNKIDTQHYIDIEEIKGFHKKISTLYEEFGKSNETKEVFFKKVTKLKRLAILKNIGASVAVLGVVVPGIMVAKRFMDKGNKEFQVKTEIKEKLQAQNNQKNQAVK